MEVLRCVCSSGKLDPDYIVCRTCRSLQHRVCMKDSCSMSDYNCAQCQIVRVNWCFEVCGYLVPPRQWEREPVMVPGVENIAGLKAVLWCMKLTREGYCMEWPSGVTCSFGSFHSPLSSACNLTSYLPSHSSPICLVTDSNVSDYLWTVAIVRRRSIDTIQRLIPVKGEDKKTSLSLLFPTHSQAQIHLLPVTPCFPVRASFCTHFACFDRDSYLMELEMKDIPECKCKICGKPCIDFRFDELFNQLQTQHGPGTILTVIPGISGVNYLPDIHEPGLNKRPKLTSDPVFTFQDFLCSNFQVEKVTDDALYGTSAYSGIEAMWLRLNTGECRCGDSTRPELDEAPVTIVRKSTPIEIDD